MATSGAPTTKNAQPSIADYAIIGDCRTAALVSRDGSIDWLCLPNFSDASIFARLLDADAGHFSIRPIREYSTSRRYLPQTPVLETSFDTASGSVQLIDLCPINNSVGTLAPMRELLRIVECTQGYVDLAVEFVPRPNYGRNRPRLRHQTGLGWRCSWSNDLIFLVTGIDLRCDGLSVRGTFRLRAGERESLSLNYVTGDIATVAPISDHAIERRDGTASWWRNWVAQCQFDGPERDAVLRSVITLKLLTFCLSGAVVAAPTSSLPEAIGEGRNWDYRYCWLRDAGLTMTALVELGFHDEASAYLDWLLHATRLTRPKLGILYDVYGRTNLREQRLPAWSGYCDSKPVRIGNNAVDQFQLDAHGQVIAAAQKFAAAGYTLNLIETRMLKQFGDFVCKTWREADNGIWEIPDPRRQYTFSKVMCWVALNSLLCLEQKGVLKLGSRATQFRRERDELAQCIESRGFSPNLDSYVGELDGCDVDAALLLMASFGYRDANHPRMISTYQRIKRELGRDGLIFRYRHGYDGLPGTEGAFGICSFFAISHLAERGMIDEAERSFERVCSFGNDLGLFAEEFDPVTGSSLGNFPQAFTHVGLIHAALAIGRGRQRVAG